MWLLIMTSDKAEAWSQKLIYRPKNTFTYVPVLRLESSKYITPLVPRMGEWRGLGDVLDPMNSLSQTKSN